MARTISFGITLLFALFFGAPALQAQIPTDLVKSFSKLTSKSDKLIGKVDPWMDTMRKTEQMIPSNLRPSYDSFNKAYTDYTGKLQLAKTDPSKLTADALTSMSGDLGKLNKQFGSLQKQFKGVPALK